MYEIQCFDSYRNTINNLTQWDIDQSLVIPIDSFNMPDEGIPSFPVYAPPEVHFSNKSRSEALVVRSEKNDEGSIKVSVPNILLQEPYPLQIYVYMTDSDNTSSQKTILHNEIPIRKRQKPSDYLYVENIDRITAEIIKDEIEFSVKEAIAEVTNQMDPSYEGGFMHTGNSIMSELNNILTETLEIADGTATEIETSIEDTMTKKGLSLQVTDDGVGNVDVSIIIMQTPSEES